MSQGASSATALPSQQCVVPAVVSASSASVQPGLPPLAQVTLRSAANPEHSLSSHGLAQPVPIMSGQASRLHNIAGPSAPSMSSGGLTPSYGSLPNPQPQQHLFSNPPPEMVRAWNAFLMSQPDHEMGRRHNEPSAALGAAPPQPTSI